jgi:energy-coupling factor transport system permease protein
VIYRRRASPLHAAGAAAGSLYCLVLAGAALVVSAPVGLAAVALTVFLAGWAAGVGRELRRAVMFALPLMVVIVVVNALVARDGLTVIVRLGDLPVLGQTDVTLEATVYGGILALRALTLVLCGALYTAAVDPDELLRLLRPFSFRSALTATLATRMVPILARDARRLADAQRCRPGPPPSRWSLIRAATSGMLDRALDVAAALEVRGYATASPRAARPGAGSRHRWAFIVAAAGVLALVVSGRVAGLMDFRAYPSLWVPTPLGQWLVAAGVMVCGLAPFLQRRGIVT